MPAAVRRSEWNSRVLMAQLKDAGPLEVVCEFIPGYMEGRRRVVLRMSLSAGDGWGVPLARGCAGAAVVSDEWELLFEVRRNRMSRKRYGPLLITSRGTSTAVQERCSPPARRVRFRWCGICESYRNVAGPVCGDLHIAANEPGLIDGFTWNLDRLICVCECWKDGYSQSGYLPGRSLQEEFHGTRSQS